MKKIMESFLIICLLIGLVSCLNAIKSNAKEASVEVKKNLEEYIENNTDDICEKTDGKSYSAFEILGMNEDEVYIWLVKANDEKGISVPVQLKIDKNYEVISHKYPENGANYKEDLETLFPKSVINKMENGKNTYIKKLENKIDEEKAMYNS